MTQNCVKFAASPRSYNSLNYRNLDIQPEVITASSNTLCKHNQAAGNLSSLCLPSATSLAKSTSSSLCSIRKRQTSAAPRCAIACPISIRARFSHCDARSSSFNSSVPSVSPEHSIRYSTRGRLGIHFPLVGLSSDLEGVHGKPTSDFVQVDI